MSLAGFLHNVAPFTAFPPELLEGVASRCSVVEAPAGSWLFHQHDDGDALYVVRSGRLELVREDPGPPAQVGVLGPGDALGELSLLLGERRTLAARTLRDSELVRLDRAEFLRLLNDSPEFTAGLTRLIARFLQDRALARGMADTHGSVLTVLALHPAASISALQAAMAQIPARRRVTVLHGEDAPAAEHARLLDEAERAHDRVFLLANGHGERSEWDQFCLRQADRVIALVPPELPVPGRGTSPELDGCDIVFWAAPHRAGDVLGWIDAVRPRSHHFVDPDGMQATLARALRRLAGLSVGVVLSGGGARSLAHIGVLSAMAERGVNVDRIGGSSFGALIAGLHALGRSPDEMAALCRREFVSSWPFNDYTVPKLALLRGRKLRAALHRLFGDAALERLPRDCFTVSADLTTSELVVHRRGPLADAVLSSLALPGMLPPVGTDGRLLIDGSVLNGMPVQVMADADEGPVVAVDVVGSRLSLRRRRRGEPLPNIIETISRSAILGGSSNVLAARRQARLVIDPDTLGAGQLDFSRLDALVEAGRKAAFAALDDAGDLLAGTVSTGGDSGGFA